MLMMRFVIRENAPVDSYAKLFSPCEAEQSGTGGTQCGMI